MTFLGLLTFINSMYLVTHGSLKIMNRCGVTVCIDKVPEDESNL